MHKSSKTLGSSSLLQAITAPAWALVLAVAVQACAEDASGGVNSQDEALKGGIPANDHGKGRPGAVAGASGAADSDDQDASTGDDCLPDTDGKGKAAKDNGKPATDKTDPTAMKDKARGDNQGQSAMGGKGQAGTGGKDKAAAKGASDAADGDDSADEAADDQDADSDEQP